MQLFEIICKLFSHAKYFVIKLFSHTNYFVIKLFSHTNYFLTSPVLESP